MKINHLKQIIILDFKSKMYMKLYKEHADTGKFIRKIKKKNRKENINMYHFVTVPFYHYRISFLNIDINKDLIWLVNIRPYVLSDLLIHTAHITSTLYEEVYTNTRK